MHARACFRNRWVKFRRPLTHRKDAAVVLWGVHLAGSWRWPQVVASKIPACALGLSLWGHGQGATQAPRRSHGHAAGPGRRPAGRLAAAAACLLRGPRPMRSGRPCAPTLRTCRRGLEALAAWAHPHACAARGPCAPLMRSRTRMGAQENGDKETRGQAGRPQNMHPPNNPQSL